MKEEKTINGFALLLVFALILGIGSFGGYFVYEKYSADSMQKLKEKASQNEIAEEVTYDEVDVTLDLVVDAYNIIPCYSGAVDYKCAYQSEKMDINTLNHEYLRAFAFTKLDQTQIVKEPALDNEIADDDWFAFEPQILQDKMKELYNTEIENGYFNVNFATSVNYDENGKYNHGVGGMSSYYSDIERNMIKAYMSKEELIIEDEFMYVIYGDYKGDYNYVINLYASSDKNNLVYTENTGEELITSERKNEVVNQNRLMMQKYKHVFKKNDQEKYYWVSTEPIE